MTNKPFWQTKNLATLTTEEWESICTGCGKCCQLKLQDEEGDEVYYTNVVCQYFDCQSRRCGHYAERCTLVPTCLKLTPQNLDKIDWIPQTCAYHILSKTGNLPEWHPLVSGKPLPAEHALPAQIISELFVPEDELEDHIIEEETDD